MENMMIDLSKLTKEELANLSEQIMNIRQNDFEKRLTDMTDKQIKQDEMINTIQKRQVEHDNDIVAIKRETNVLCSPIHHKRRKRFMAKASKRVKFLLGDDSNCPEYVLFAPFFFKGIYTDIANRLEIGWWDDVSMENYDKDDSEYGIAKDFRDSWMPNYKYYKRCLSELIEKRDNGLLPQERCRALTLFLNATNNGENVSFVR